MTADIAQAKTEETVNDFTQLCVWPATIVGEDKVQEFEGWLQSEFGVRGKYKCELKTNSSLDPNGFPIPETGGRNDAFFYIHQDDINKFAVARLSYGIRWWEDVIKYNDTSTNLYPAEFVKENQPTW
jgi:hypothetical protein